MAHVVCQAVGTVDRLTLTWSEGTVVLEPYMRIKEAAEFSECHRTRCGIGVAKCKAVFLTCVTVDCRF